jgi:anti-anti-sigma regulatory factor
MLDLAIVARRLRRAGHAMRLCGPQPQVGRVIEIVGLDRLPSVVLQDFAPVIG